MKNARQASARTKDAIKNEAEIQKTEAKKFQDARQGNSKGEDNRKSEGILNPCESESNESK